MAIIFFTGFPGFLGSELLPRLLMRAAADEAVCLVQPKYASLARERAAAIVAAHPALANRIRIVEGDITARIGAETEGIAEIYHLAAIYDLAVQRDVGVRVNVDGTRNVLEFAWRCSGLRRLHYVSTCYVSGRYAGRFTEGDLEKGQAFNNFYEETKYLAEVEVRRAMQSGLPATIYRPSVVVGDSATGATQKFDGPYFVMQWLMRQPRLAMLPVAGNPRAYRFNVVPSNFIVDAIERLSALPQSLGRTYQLADPDPLTVHETIDTIAAATGRRVLRIPLTKALAKAALRSVPGVYRLMRIPPEAVDYFVHPTTYDTTNATRDLGDVRVPHLRDYAAQLVAFARAHPEVGSKAMA
ncbi:MAG: non-ribosomal peptide synthase, dehydrogenase protein [Acidobacteria bacterium]|nr:non-ribosomal peptide synthase, dehydrogenase protein [Acidobacteriota bacterium]